jgi:hypothetical protein
VDVSKGSGDAALGEVARPRIATAGASALTAARITPRLSSLGRSPVCACSSWTDLTYLLVKRVGDIDIPSRADGQSSSRDRCGHFTSGSAPAAATRWRAWPRRGLACLFWCLLTRDENYAHAQPSLTTKKLRKLELIAGAKRLDGSAAGIWTANQAMREAEKQLARQAEASYVRMVRDWQATAPKKVGASATPERA